MAGKHSSFVLVEWDSESFLQSHLLTFPNHCQKIQWFCCYSYITWCLTPVCNVCYIYTAGKCFFHVSTDSLVNISHSPLSVTNLTPVSIPYAALIMSEWPKELLIQTVTTFAFCVFELSTVNTGPGFDFGLWFWTKSLDFASHLLSSSRRFKWRRLP